MIIDQRQCRFEIIKRRIGKARQQRLEPVAHFRLIGRTDRAQRTPVKRIAERDQVRPLGIAVYIMIAPRSFDCALKRFGP